MNANPMTVSGGVESYEFVLPGATFGTNSSKEIEPRVCGLFPGDANADGLLQDLDSEAYIDQTGSGASNNATADFDMDVEVEALDFNSYVTDRAARAASQVP